MDGHRNKYTKLEMGRWLFWPEPHRGTHGRVNYMMRNGAIHPFFPVAIPFNTSQGESALVFYAAEQSSPGPAALSRGIQVSVWECRNSLIASTAASASCPTAEISSGSPCMTPRIKSSKILRTSARFSSLQMVISASNERASLATAAAGLICSPCLFLKLIFRLIWFMIAPVHLSSKPFKVRINSHSDR